MGGNAGAAGAAGGATGAPAGGVGPTLLPGGTAGFRMPQIDPKLADGFRIAGGGLMQPQQQEQFINQLASKGPPPTIQPMPMARSGIGQQVGQALIPMQQRPLLPQPIRMPMTRGEQLTAPQPPNVGMALGGY